MLHSPNYETFFQCGCEGDVFRLCQPPPRSLERLGRSGSQEAWLICINCGDTQPLIANWAP